MSQIESLGTQEHRPRSSRWSMARIATGVLPLAFILVWSSGYLAGSIGAHSGPPLALLAWRFLVAFVVLGAISLLTRAPWPRQPSVYLHLLVIGILLQTVQFGLLYVGLGLGVTAGLASLILSAAPLAVAAAAVALFGEKLTGWQWLGLAIGLIGVVVSLTEKLTGQAQLTGYALTGLALLGLVGGTLYQKRFGQEVDLRTGTTVQLFGATVTAFPLAALHGGLSMPMTAPALGSLAWLAIVNSIGSFTLLFILLRARSGGAATSLLYLVPPVTSLLAVPLLGQSISVLVVIGMAISAVGVLLVIFAKGKDDDRSATVDSGRAGVNRRSVRCTT